MSDNEETEFSRRPLLIGVWLWVGLPFLYGVFELVRKVVQLFGG